MPPPPKDYLTQWYTYLKDAMRMSGRSIEYQHNTRQLLHAAGFTDIREQVIRASYNSWPADAHHKEIGRWYNIVFTEGLEAMSLGPFNRLNRWTLEQFMPFLGNVKAQAKNRKVHAYNNM